MEDENIKARLFKIEWISALFVMVFAYLQGFVYEVAPVKLYLASSFIALAATVMFIKAEASFGRVIV